MQVMQAAVLLGRDCRIVFQNERSRAMRRWEPGTSLIREHLVLPNEEIRDIVFSGKRLRFVDQPSSAQWGEDLLVTRDYNPMYSASGRVKGLISIGYTRAREDASDFEALESISSFLEHQLSQHALCGESPPPGKFRGAPEGWSRIIERLQQFQQRLRG